MTMFNLPAEWTVTCNTKANADATAISQTITFKLGDDFDDEALKNIVSGALTIKSQGEDRRKATAKENPVAIPVTKTVTVTKASTRTADPDKPYKEILAKQFNVKPSEITVEQITQLKAILGELKPMTDEA